MKSKTNRILSLTVALIMLLTLATPIGGAYADTEGDYTYTVTDSKATITGYTGTDNNLVIPDTLGGYPVTEIGSNALREKGLIGVTLPNTLVTIGDYAFIFDQINTLDIPDSVTSIGKSAFFENVIVTLTLGDSLETIGASAFKSNQICTLTLPTSLTSIGGEAFLNNGLSYDSGTITGSELAGTWNVVGTTWVKVLLPQEPPTSVTAVNSILPNMEDGKLTGTTALMEYQTDNAHDNNSEYWIAAAEGETGLDIGVYWIRYAATGAKSASEAVKMTVGFTIPFAGGEGTELSPYQIETAAQLDAVRYFLVDPFTEHANNFILTKDIDLGVAPYNTGTGWEPIEAEDDFGVLNGNGHVIKNMKINESEESGKGLFGMLRGGRVINLGITDANVIGDSYVGILAAVIDSEAHIEKVYVTGTVTGDGYVGGLTGYLGMTIKTIKNCYAIADVTGYDYVGGLVGGMMRSRIVNSYFAGNVVAENPDSLYKGGLVGENDLDEHADVPQLNVFVSNYYYNMADATGFNGEGGTAKSAVEMKNNATYLVGTGEEIWDFDTVWTINPAVNNGYPTLRIFGVTPTTGGSGGGQVRPPTPDSTLTVNGQKETAGKETRETVNGVVQVKLDVNEDLLSQKIEAVLKEKTDSSQNLVELVVGSGDNATVQLTGDIVKKMEKEDFDLSIKKDKVEYMIPASEITIDKVADILGVAPKDLKDINIEVKINKVSDEVLAKYNEVAKQFKNEFVVPPVDFEIVAKTTGTDGKVSETTVSKFSNYVERVIELPANVDASKITTGIVFNADGTYSHVPTTVFQKDGKWYARINSLTNSTYSVIYNPITVDSVKNHWAEDAVNDMASRLVLIDYKNFEANEAVTRAEFADYLVRALGLYREDVTLKTTFKDVTADSNNSRSIQIASDWGIVSGYSDGTFKATNTIARQESMVMYARAMEIVKIAENKANQLATYTDSGEVAEWATPSVQRVVNADIFNGKGNGVLAPKGTLTQAEALTAVQNLLVKAELISK